MPMRESRIPTRYRLLMSAVAFLIAAAASEVRCTEPSIAAHERSFRTTKLYTAGQAGYRTYRIPAIAIAPKGAILTAVAGRYDSASDWANVDLMFRRSIDNGETWTDQEVLVNDGTNTVDNPTFIVDAPNGETHLMYQINYARAY